MPKITLAARRVALDVISVGDALDTPQFKSAVSCMRGFFAQLTSAGGTFTGMRVRQVIVVSVCDHQVELFEENGAYAVRGLVPD